MKPPAPWFYQSVELTLLEAYSGRLGAEQQCLYLYIYLT